MVPSHSIPSVRISCFGEGPEGIGCFSGNYHRDGTGRSIGWVPSVLHGSCKRTHQRGKAGGAMAQAKEKHRKRYTVSAFKDSLPDFPNFRAAIAQLILYGWMLVWFGSPFPLSSFGLPCPLLCGCSRSLPGPHILGLLPLRAPTPKPGISFFHTSSPRSPPTAHLFSTKGQRHGVARAFGNSVAVQPTYSTDTAAHGIP